MSSIILSTTLREQEASTQLVTLHASVPNEADWSGIFNRLQFFRSKMGPSGPFEEITAATWTPPRIPVDGGDEPDAPVTGAYVNAVGLDLDLLINDDQLTVTFTGSNPLTLAQTAEQITEQGNGRLKSYVDANGQLVIESTQPGLSSRLALSESDGSIALNLPVSDVTGKDIRPVLTHGKKLYSINDVFGNREYYYRTKFLNSVTGAQSEANIAANPKNALGLATENVVIGYVELVSPSGSVWEGAEVRLYSESSGPLVDGKLVTGGPTVKNTDESGRAEFQVVRGQRVTVSVQGTSHVRTLTVPTDISMTAFNFFSPGIADDDVFTVSVPDLVYATRRTL